MAKILLRSPGGVMIFEDPGPLLYGEESVTPALVCPDCTSGCETQYFSTMPAMTGTCGSDCSGIVDQTLTQVGSDCQWTAAQNGWTHEIVCASGIWYYRVWTGGIGGTLCAEWTEVNTTPPVDSCPPLGGTGDSTWAKTGGGCSGTEIVISAPCPADCSGCPSSYTFTLSGFSSCLHGFDVNGTYTMTRSGCGWSGSNAGGVDCDLSCSDVFGREQWHATFTGILVIINATKQNIDGCPPTGTWAQENCECSTCGTVVLS